MAFFNWAAPLIHRYGKRWDADSARSVAALLGLEGSARGEVLDVGGGSGHLAELLADLAGVTVTVLDPTPQLLDRLPEHAGVKGVLGAAESIPFADDEFDGVVVTDAFHHFRDQSAALDEMRRVMKPAGRLLILDFDPTVGQMWMIVWGERLLGEPASFLTPTELCVLAARHGLRGDCDPLGGANYRFVAEKGRPQE